ncbi:MAG: hypothetical protein ACHREM_01470 [Polyangiales bacterium]
MRIHTSAAAIVFAVVAAACSAPVAPACAPCACADGPKKDATTTAGITSLDVGVLVFDIGVTDTAQLFHIADQVTAWNPFAHKQYARWLDATHAIGPTEQSALDAHRTLRKRLGYGVIDQTFYTARTIDAALATTSLAAADVETERVFLRTMSPLIMPIVEREHANVVALRDAIVARRDTLSSMLADLASFAEVYIAKEHVPLWLIATTDPANGGGGYNGGQMTVEASRGATELLMHESLHFVLHHRSDVLSDAARACGAGLDKMTLEEGIAYALYPGIVGPTNAIRHELERLAREAKPVDDPFVRFNRLGLALTPVLEKALVNKTKLTTLLPEACAAYKRIAAETWP